jgi:membrane fusion protein (multidrug efflux system)
MNAAVQVKADAGTTELERAPVPLAVVETQAAPSPTPKKKRRGGRFFLMALLPALLVVGGGYFWITGGRYQDTDNANLRQARVSITSEATGRIVESNVGENIRVKAGDVLFVVDPEPYRIALAQADAALAAARIDVEQLRAAYSQAIAQERVAAGELDYSTSQYERSKELAGRGISAKSALDEAKRDLDKAGEQHTVAKQGIASALAALGGDPEIATDAHPAVLAAQAARDKAAYALAQTTVRAPADGVVSQANSFKVGQYVGPGTALFSLVETSDTWIEANFKETQLTNMKLGQKAEVVLDTYPGRTFEATVQSIGAGTGAEFSLLPAQNATGNWVKVTQRIPVRLKLDQPPTDMALKTGMSADVSVDTGVSRGLGGLFGSAIAAQ